MKLKGQIAESHSRAIMKFDFHSCMKLLTSIIISNFSKSQNHQSAR